MTESFPPFLRHWVTRQAEAMGLPGPDDYMALLIRLEKQRQALAAFAKTRLHLALSPVLYPTYPYPGHLSAGNR
jgi:hypothetical protein